LPRKSTAKKADVILNVQSTVHYKAQKVITAREEFQLHGKDEWLAR